MLKISRLAILVVLSNGLFDVTSKMTVAQESPVSIFEAAIANVEAITNYEVICHTEANFAWDQNSALPKGEPAFTTQVNYERIKMDYVGKAGFYASLMLRDGYLETASEKRGTIFLSFPSLPGQPGKFKDFDQFQLGGRMFLPELSPFTGDFQSLRGISRKEYHEQNIQRVKTGEVSRLANGNALVTIVLDEVGSHSLEFDATSMLPVQIVTRIQDKESDKKKTLQLIRLKHEIMDGIARPTLYHFESVDGIGSGKKRVTGMRIGTRRFKWLSMNEAKPTFPTEDELLKSLSQFESFVQKDSWSEKK